VRERERERVSVWQARMEDWIWTRHCCRCCRREEGEREEFTHSQIIFRFVIINIKRESKRVKIIMNNKYSGNVRYVIVLISLIRSLTIQLVLNLFSLSSGVPLYGAVTNGSL